MLHILWMIIKFLLILIGIILGLVLLAVLLILFCPFRYHVSAEKADQDFKKTKLYISASWLFHGVWVRLFYQQGKMNTGIYLFGIPIHKFFEKKKSGEKKKEERKRFSENILKEEEFEEEKEELELSNESEEEISEECLDKEKKLELSNEIEEICEDKLDIEEKDILELSDEMNETNEKVSVEMMDNSREENMEEESLEEESQKKTVQILEKIRNILTGVSGKLKSVGKPGSAAEKIANKLNSVKEKINKILDKINWWKNFLKHPKVKDTIKCTKNALIRMLKHIIPTRLYGDVIFGSTDPAITGAVLAMLGMTMPFHKNCVNVTPIFEEKNVLTGNIQLKGRIYIIVLLFQVLKVVINKNLWYTIKYWKNKEES